MRKLNLKWMMLIFMFNIGSYMVHAQEGELIVKVNGVESKRIPVESLQKLTFNNDKLNIITTNNEEVLNVPLSDIVLVFYAEATNTKAVNVGSLQIWQSGSFLYVQNDGPLGTIVVMDLQGRRRIAEQCAENTTSINMSTFEKGIYILQINKTAIKFILK